jgi:hypothetical protein
MNTTSEKTIGEQVWNEPERLEWHRNGCYIGYGMPDRWNAVHDFIMVRIEREEKNADR